MIPKAFAPTPIEEIAYPNSAGLRFFIKREDLLPFSFGGNKVRIAAAFLADMRAKGKNAMILYGDRRSNLCRVLSAACAEEGIPYIIISSSEHGNGVPAFNERIIGALTPEIIDCEKNAVAEAVDEAFRRLRARGYDPYYIYGDRTGKGNEAVPASAYAAVWPEIAAWEKENVVRFREVFVPAGTGGTHAGLCAGAYMAGSDTPVIGISISSRTKERACAAAEEGFAGCLARRGIPLPDDPAEHLRLFTEYNGGGYGLYDLRIEEVIAQMLRLNAIPMDPTYTGKAFLGMLDHLKKTEEKDACVLFVHTGGLPLFFDYMHQAAAE